MRTLAAVKARARPDRYAILLPMNEVEPLLALALQQDDPLLRDDGRYGNFDSRAFDARSALYVDMFREGYAPPVTASQIDQRVERVRPRHVRVLHLRALEHRRVRAAAAAGDAACVGDGAAAGARAVRAHRSRAARAWSSSAHRASKDAAWQLIEYLARARHRACAFTR